MTTPSVTKFTVAFTLETIFLREYLTVSYLPTVALIHEQYSFETVCRYESSKSDYLKWVWMVYNIDLKTVHKRVYI